MNQTDQIKGKRNGQKGKQSKRKANDIRHKQQFLKLVNFLFW